MNIDHEVKAPKFVKIPTINMLFVNRDLDHTGYIYPPNQEWANPNPGQRNMGYSDIWDKPDEEVIKYLTEVEMFSRVRKLEDGSFVGCMKLAFTMSVCCDITPTTPYAYRWCFKDPEEAFYFCDNIKEFDEIPERRQTLQGHRYTKESRLAATDQLGIKRW